MMHHVRPYKMFDQVPGSPMERIVRVAIPSRRGAETLTVLTIDTMLLLAAMKIVKAKRIFEFGTSVGATTLNMAMNSTAHITTIDRDRKPRDYEGTKYAKNITEIDCDSLSFEVERFGVADFIFIDGGPDLKTVERDTSSAFGMIGDNKGCIAWHDYRNPTEPEVTEFLDSMSRHLDLVHVEDSWMCFWFSNKKITERILA